MRDNFTNTIKRKLAERVAWRCSFPGCNKITVGPGHKDSEDVVNLGEAAHIYAASENGPRPNPKLSSEERRSIDNGIWMCRAHAKLIDSDYTEYSGATLSKWKKQAEQRVYQELKTNSSMLVSSLTLVRLGNSIVFDGIWRSVKGNKWKFEVDSFIKGSLEILREIFDSISDIDKFIIVESQGDGRVLDNFCWEFEDNKNYIEALVQEKEPRENPDNLQDYASAEDGDLMIVDGDFKIVKGIECAKKMITDTLSLSHGELLCNPLLGSYLADYFWTYRENLELLNRLVKMEVTRLISVPTYDPLYKTSTPPLNFINRIIETDIISTEVIKGQIPIRIKLEWGNGELWEDTVRLHVPGRSNGLSSMNNNEFGPA